MPRRLCIAVSVFFALVAVAFAVLWVRSYRAVTNIQTNIGPNRAFQCTSKFGSVYLHSYSLETQRDRNEWLTGVWNYPQSSEEFERWTYEWQTATVNIIVPPSFQFEVGAYNLPRELLIRFPHWFAVLVAGGLALAIGIRLPSRRFSIRTMLIATTLIAVVLGLAVWAGR